MSKFIALVEIEAPSISDARNVLNERIYYEEDYGFEYEISFRSDAVLPLDREET